MRPSLYLLAAALLALSLGGCADSNSHSRGVYLLLDTSGTYTAELEKAEAIIKYLVGTLEPGDSLAVARIDSGSFSEKDIVAKATFDTRPSTANAQKRAFIDKVDSFISTVQGSSYTDISGGLLQAVEHLTETGAARRYILIFSDLEEDLAAGHVRDFDLPLDGFQVVALNVTKLRSDIRDPKEYLGRLAAWHERVDAGGGVWRVVNDLDRLEHILGD